MVSPPDLDSQASVHSDLRGLAGAAMQDAISPMGTEPEASGDFGGSILDKLKWSNYLQDGAPQICLLAYQT